MCRKIFLLLLLLVAMAKIQLASAQSAEVQQLILNLEKLSQLKSILSNMKKGYEIAVKGYGRIKDVTQGNYKLHEAFLDGLLAVNPELRKYRKVPDIIRYQAEILAEYKRAFKQVRDGGRFSPEEIEYFAKVYANLLDRSVENLDELAGVVTAGELRMSDQERIRAIDRLYDDMQRKRSFLRGFNRRALTLDVGRAKAIAELQMLKEMQGQ